MKRLSLLFLLGGLLLLMAMTPDRTTTIFVIGDSTAANKDTTGGKQERGWGMMLQECFDANYIVVDNHAVNGRSSKSFIDEGDGIRCSQRSSLATMSSYSLVITTRNHSLHATPNQVLRSMTIWPSMYARHASTAEYQY